MILPAWQRSALHSSGPAPDPPIPLTPDIWFDPADAYTDAASIGSWTAREGGLVLTAPGSKPTRALKGTRRVLAFNRSLSQYLTLPDAVTVRTIFIVARYAAPVFADYDGLAGSAGAGTIIWTGNGGSSNFYQGSATLYLDGVQTVAAGCGDWHVYEAIVTSDFNLAGLTIGRDRYESGRHWDGAIADVVGYSAALDSSARAEVREWLAARYGL